MSHLKYIIDCRNCGKVHKPKWGSREELVSLFDPPKTIIIPYICPDKQTKGQVEYPFDSFLNTHSIIGWEDG